jgi:hypothetical protein
MSRRDTAMKLLDDNVPDGIEIQSKRDATEFKRLTGTSHETLVANWKSKPPGIMSACNGFVSWYAGSLGITGIASWFKLQESMRSIGKGHAWETSNGKSEPQPGDILHHYREGTGLHVDVCIGFTEDHKLVRAAAGQITFLKPRNPDKEFDVLKRVTGAAAYNYRNLLGWLDIEQFFWNPPVTSAEPTGSWVVGWWKVYDGNQYYYYFDADGYVQYTKKPPASPYMPPKVPLNSGTYTYEPNRRLVVEWNPADGGQTIETFSAKIDLTAMNGTSNRYAPLYASRYTAKR